MSSIEAPVPSKFAVAVKAKFAQAVAFVKAHPVATTAVLAFLAALVIVLVV